MKTLAMRRSCRVWTFLAMVTVSHLVIRSGVGADLSLGVFSVDIIPPIGEGACIGFMPSVTRIEHPLLLKGIVLRSTQGTWVLAAADLCGICNSSHDRLRRVLAEAADSTEDRVVVQSLHQHTAPVLDLESARLIHGEEHPRYQSHLDYQGVVEQAARRGASGALRSLRPVTRVVGSQAKVHQVASNRRVPLGDGTIGVRASLTRDPTIRDADEGLIDPWLRSVTFFQGDQPLAELYFYATHPQTFYGNGRISWDMVGMAREQLQSESGVFTVYFTGCGGNVTVGKYNDGTPAARARLAESLFDAMRKAQLAARESPDAVVRLAELPDSAPEWHTAEIAFNVRNDGLFELDALTRKLASEDSLSARVTAGSFLAFRQRLEEGHRGRVARLRLGAIELLFLPGEPFVEYQLFAQRVAGNNRFVGMAGYGDCGVWYFGPDSIYQDRGGYEQTWSLTGPCQQSVETALRGLLRP